MGPREALFVKLLWPLVLYNWCVCLSVCLCGCVSSNFFFKSLLLTSDSSYSNVLVWFWRNLAHIHDLCQYAKKLRNIFSKFRSLNLWRFFLNCKFGLSLWSSLHWFPNLTFDRRFFRLGVLMPLEQGFSKQRSYRGRQRRTSSLAFSRSWITHSDRLVTDGGWPHSAVSVSLYGSWQFIGNLSGVAR